MSIESGTLGYVENSMFTEQSSYRDRDKDRKKWIEKYGDREGGEGLLKGYCRALEPHHFLHGGVNTFFEIEFLTLEVYDEGVRLAAANKLDGAVINYRRM